MPRKKKLTIERPSQLETLKRTPSEMAKEAPLRSGGGDCEIERRLAEFIEP